jgi:hypothetical protein
MDEASKLIRFRYNGSPIAECYFKFSSDLLFQYIIAIKFNYDYNKNHKNFREKGVDGEMGIM